MEIVTILRELWRRRYLVAIAAVLAIAIGLMTAYKVSPSKLQGRQYHVGVASARMLIDTPDSQVVDLEPKGADGLGTRANLLANLMASGPVKAIIAEHAGINAAELIAIAPSMSGGPQVPTPLSQRAAASASNPEAYVLTLRSDEALPIISVDAQAPDAEHAARLADAATTGLRDYLKSVAAAQNVPNARQLVISTLGAAQSADVVRGPRRLFALLAAMFTFGFMCAAIVLISGLARGWRQAVAAERASVQELAPQADSDQPGPEAKGARAQARPARGVGLDPMEAGRVRSGR
jgi:capsular polysaccharide biosynthesis protein